MSTPRTNDPDGLISQTGGACPAGGCPLKFTNASVSSDSGVASVPIEAVGCERLQGGTIKPSAPVFTPVVVNAVDMIWRDDDYRPVQEDTGEVILIDDAF